MNLRVGLSRKLSAELMLLNCGVGENSWGCLDCKEMELVNPKGNQFCMFIGRTDSQTEAPIFWSPDAKNWFIGKEPDAGKDWRPEEKGTTENEMVRWHHWLNGHEFEQAWELVMDREAWLCIPRCCSQTRLSDWTELNRTVNIVIRDDNYTFLPPQLWYR